MLLKRRTIVPVSSPRNSPHTTLCLFLSSLSTVVQNIIQSNGERTTERARANNESGERNRGETQVARIYPRGYRFHPCYGPRHVRQAGVVYPVANFI